MDPDVNEQPAQNRLGARLVTAREARGLAPADVVRMLRLPAATLHALESGSYEQLPPPVFVHGYLRAYARLLGLDAEMLIAEYDQHLETPAQNIRQVTRDHHQKKPHTRHIRTAAVLIVVTTLLLAGPWWYKRLNPDLPVQSRPASPIPEQAALPESRSSLALPDTPEPDDGPVLAPHAAPEPVMSDAADASVAAIGAGVPPDATAVTAEPVLTVMHDAPVSANPDTVEQRTGLESTAERTVTDLPIAPLAAERKGLVRASRAPTGEGAIVIKANDETWADIVDAHGYQLLYSLLRPGIEYRLAGQAPFRVFLGNAPAVELILNQERFDHTPFHRRNNTARFSMPAGQ